MNLQKLGQSIKCEKCGRMTPKRTNGIQKYCPICSEKRDLERKGKWAKENNYKRVYSQEERNIRRRQTSEVGKEINKELKSDITWIADAKDEFNTTIRVAMPFEYSLSKNATWSTTGQGHVFLRSEHRKYRDAISARIRLACRETKIYEDKVWIDILVQKPNHRGDAINVLDAVADALKTVLEIDDRWFCVRRIDWEIVKENPMIYIGISQNSEGHKRICSRCGRILHLTSFWKDKSNRLGVGRECKDCMTKKNRKSKS